MGDQPDYTGSCMIALFPPPEAAGALARDGGLGQDEIHLTVAYCGDAADVDPIALNAAAQALADARAPFTATISGHARFTAGTKDCIVALADSPHLDELRRDTETALAGQRIPIPSEHGFTPHLAISYLGEDEADPVGRLAAFPVRFTTISAVHGKDRTDYPLTGAQPLPELAAEAYLTGWALSGGPLTERATPGCAAAIAAALDHAQDPRVLEVTLQIGKLEGAWALVFDRREKLIADHTAKIQAIWRKAAGKLDAAAMVRSFRQHAGMTREARDSGWAAILRSEAIAAAAGMLNGILSGPEFEQFVTAIELALAAALAEGQTAAMAIAAELAGHDGFDWDAAFDHMYEPLTHLEALPGMADEWVQRLIAGNAADIGRALAALASDGGTYEEMLAAVEALTTGDSIRAVQVLIDYAMSGSAGQGALNLYAAEGVTEVAWLTAGDERVCLTCEANEAQGPYPPEQFPELPAHPLCRCSPAPQTGPGLSLQAYGQFLPAAA